MDLQEIRQSFLAGQAVSPDEERFFINGIRRGRAAALETRKTSVTRAVAAERKRTGARGLDDTALGSLLDSL